MLKEVAEILESLKLKPSDLRIYSLLEKRELSVREIAKELNLSTRFVRERLRDLHRKGIVRRRLVENGWIGYVYRAEDPKVVVARVKNYLLSEFGRLEKILESF
ncbi:MAG: transcriptional regulator [Archaeoglobi archaeon]|jgi:predicted DNA-binding transcriptional regulator|nr:transcriptional regulator [Archaeoglobi archaeon]TDA28674.1 MAG: transcriptional regulator [Archaeoglobi archaeon]